MAINKQLAILEEERLALQQDYLEKLKKQKVLTKLKEVKYSQYKTRQLRQNEKILNDIIMAQYSQE
jgi:hypothetical protein